MKNCDPCQQSRLLPAAAPLQPWEWPKCPWAHTHIHVDYAGPFLGHTSMFLILVDANSKWMDVKQVPAATKNHTTDQLCSIFATHAYGIPEIVSDNGSVFTRTDFKNFIKSNGIHHVTCAPHHPASSVLLKEQSSADV